MRSPLRTSHPKHLPPPKRWYHCRAGHCCCCSGARGAVKSQQTCGPDALNSMRHLKMYYDSWRNVVGTCPPLQRPITPGQVNQYPKAASFGSCLAGPSLFQQQRTLKTIKSIPTVSSFPSTLLQKMLLQWQQF